MNREIRWGFMGTGRIAGCFAKALTVAEGAVCYAAASRTLEKGKSFAAEYGFAKAYGSYEEMLRDDAVDVVYIATPVREHYNNIKMCLEAGKHVLCEKALTVNAAQARQVVALARVKHLFLMEAMWTKCQPVFRRMRQWVADGVIGEVQAVDINFYTAAGKGHRLYRHELAGGALLDLGYYPVICAGSFLGSRPKAVLSHSVIGKGNVDYLDSIILEYEGGKFAHLLCGLGTKKTASMYILGTKGRISLQDGLFFMAERAQAVDFEDNVLASCEEPFLMNGYEYEAMEVMDCIREGKTESALVTLDDTVAVMEILDRCRADAGFYYEFE